MEISEYVRALKRLNSDSEVWWDSSPSLYGPFRKLLMKHHPYLFSYIKRLLPIHFLDPSVGISGATTNPGLIAKAALENAGAWFESMGLIERQLPIAERAQLLYDQLVSDGAHQLHPLWVMSARRYGWFSAQIDTGQIRDSARMVTRGLALSKLGPNVMIKVPGSEAGYRAIEQLVAKGRSINNTLCFSVSQVSACLSAIHRGQSLARHKNIDTASARYVISFMIGRFGDEPAFEEQARRAGITLTATDKRWAELAIYQAIQALLQRWETPARLLLCSLRVDVDENGEESCWHLEKTGACTTLYTLRPEMIEFLLRRHTDGSPVLPAGQSVQVPERVMNKLLCIPYFTEAYFLGGIADADFETQSAFITARNEACIAHRQLESFVDGFGATHPVRRAADSKVVELRGMFR